MSPLIISDYGAMLAKTGERLVIRGSKPWFRPMSEADPHPGLLPQRTAGAGIFDLSRREARNLVEVSSNS
jgi:hypothetical protein